METFSALLALSPVTGEFPSLRPVVRSFDVFFDLRLNKRLSKQSWGWRFEMPSRSLWRHRNGTFLSQLIMAHTHTDIYIYICVCTDVYHIMKQCQYYYRFHSKSSKWRAYKLAKKIRNLNLKSLRNVEKCFCRRASHTSVLTATWRFRHWHYSVMPWKRFQSLTLCRTIQRRIPLTKVQ